MDVNLPQQGLPLSPTGEVSHAPEAKKAASSSFPRDCTKIPRGSELAQRAAGVSSVAHQEMSQASSSMSQRASPLASRELDMHPGEGVRGEDSAAVTEAFHHIASQHGGREGSGSVLRAEARGVSTLQQPKMGEREEAAPQEPPPSYFLGPGEEDASRLPERGPPSYSSRQSEDVSVEESQSHTLVDSQAATLYMPGEQDVDAMLMDAPPEEDVQGKTVPEAFPAAVEGIDTPSGIAFSLFGPLAELTHEGVHSGRLDPSLEKGLQRRMQAIAEDAVSIDKWQVLGLLDSMAVKDHGEENLGSVEREILQKGYTLIHEYRGIYRDPEGHVVVFESNGMRATKGALTKSFLDTLPLERRRLAEEHIASGRVGLISPEELEEHARAGAAIAERVHSEVSSAYQDFKKQLAEEQEKAKQVKDDTKRDDDNAQLRRHSQTRHLPRGTPTLEDASKESQEKTIEKEEEKAGQGKEVLKGVKDSKIEDLRSKDKKQQTKHINDQQKQKEAGQRIDIEEQKKKEDPPRAPPKGTNTSSA